MPDDAKIGTDLNKLTKKQLIQMVEEMRSAGAQGVDRDLDDIFSIHPHGLKMLFANSDTGMTIVQTGGKIRAANQAYCKMVGYSQEELLELSVLDITHEDDIAASEEAVSKLDDLTRFTKRYITKSGDIVWGSVLRTPITDEKGRVLYTISQIEDITERHQVLDEMERQRSLFQALFDGSQEPMVLADPERNILMCNPAFYRIFDYQEDDLIGQSVGLIYAEIDEFERQGRIRFNTESNPPDDPYVVTYKKRNGETFPGETVSGLIKDADGNHVGFLGVVRDISVRVAAQQALSASERKFRDFAQAAADRFWETDDQHRYTYNSPGNELFPNPSSVLKGKRRWEVAGFEAEETELARYLDAINNRRAFRTFRYRLTDENNDIWYRRASGIPLFDDKGDFVGYRGTTVDETNEVKARQQADRLQNRFLSAIESVNAGFVLWDENLRFIACNNFFRELMEDNVPDLAPGLTYEDYMRHRSHLVSVNNETISAETWFEARMQDMAMPESTHETPLKGGRWVRIRKRRLADGSIMALHTDITGDKRREADLIQARVEAEAANRAKSEFLGNVSHELRTPLSAILGFAQLMARRPDDITPEKAARYGNVIRDNSAHLMDLIRDLLDVSAIEAGRVSLQVAKTDLYTILEETLRLLSPRIEESDVSVLNNLSQILPPLKADPVKLKQILVNLISNSIKFTEPGKELLIEASEDGEGALQIRVADSGIGMTLPELEKAMEMFGRVTTPSIGEKEGTGLGLPLTKGLIEAHGGLFQIESQPGKGTTVTFTIPLYEAETVAQ